MLEEFRGVKEVGFRPGETLQIALAAFVGRGIRLATGSSTGRGLLPPRPAGNSGETRRSHGAADSSGLLNASSRSEPVVPGFSPLGC